jgi:predicted phosphodiesterase
MGGTFFFNPGYAGNSRLNTQRSVAIITLDGVDLRWEYLPL